ncbi:MAG: hypothetical protein ACPL8I_12690, partial [Chloroflexaceae bacterium]
RCLGPAGLSLGATWLPHAGRKPIPNKKPAFPVVIPLLSQHKEAVLDVASSRSMAHCVKTHLPGRLSVHKMFIICNYFEQNESFDSDLAPVLP